MSARACCRCACVYQGSARPGKENETYKGSCEEYKEPDPAGNLCGCGYNSTECLLFAVVHYVAEPFSLRFVVKEGRWIEGVAGDLERYAAGRQISEDEEKKDEV